MLSSWKEIAHFFGKGVRTVQRWEKTLDLPIHRPPGAPSNVVLARTSDLEEWMHRGPVAKAVEEAPAEVTSVALTEELGKLEREVTYLANLLGVVSQSPAEFASSEERLSALTELVSRSNAKLSGENRAVRAA